MAKRSKPIYKERYKVKRPDGTVEVRETEWYYVRWTDASGKQQKQKAAPTYSQAREVLTQRLKDVADERAGIRRVDMHKMRLDDLLDRYLEAKEPHVSEAQVTDIGSAVRRAISECRAVFVADLNRDTLNTHLNRLTHEGKGGRTVNKHLAHIKGMFNWTVEVGLLPFNPVAGVKPRPQHEKRRRRRALTAAQARQLLTTARDDKRWHGEHVAYALQLYAALRPGEAGKIIWADLDLDSDCPTLSIRPEISKNKRRAVLPVHPELAEILANWHSIRPALPAASVVTWPDHPNDKLKKTLKRAGIEYKTPNGQVDRHALRHTCLTLLSRSGCGARTLQAFARHSTAALTLDVYVHPHIADMESAMLRLPSMVDEKHVREGTTGGALSKVQATAERQSSQDISSKQLTPTSALCFESCASTSFATPGSVRTEMQ